MGSNKPSEWYAQRGLIFWRVERRLWWNAFGSGYEWHKYANGILRRFWSRAEAEGRAVMLNGLEEKRNG